MLLGMEMRAFGPRSPVEDDPDSGVSASVGSGSDGTEIDPGELELPELDDELPDPSSEEESVDPEPEPDESCDVPEDPPPVTPFTMPLTGSLGCELPPLPSSAKATPV
jgi:hypothetical protein